MSLTFTSRQKIVSLFIICGLILFFVSLIAIGRGKKFFGKKNHYFTTFRSGDGLQKGMVVYMNGFPIGTLENIVLDYKNNVILKIGIYEEHWTRIKEGSIVRLISPLIGSKTLEIIPGDFNSPVLPSFSALASYDSDEGVKMLYAQQKKNPSSQIDTIIDNTSEIMKKINDPRGILNNTSEMIRKMNDPQGPLFANLENFKTIGNNISKISDNFVKSQEKIDNIFNHAEQATENIETISKSIMSSSYFEKKTNKPSSTGKSKKSSINLNESYSPYKGQ